MSRSSDRSQPRLVALMLLVGALLLGGLDYVTWAERIGDRPARGLAQYFFMRQDFWVVGAYALALLFLAYWAARIRPVAKAGKRAGEGQGVLILLGILGAAVAAWLGRSLVFHDYSPSRDEVMVELAGAYLADGRIGWPIPPEWMDFSRAMMPEFYSPYGADSYWTAIYLPVHAAIRALFIKLGNADLAGPVTLAIGLLALWQIARKLMPERRDGQAVTMVMALSSTQLIATAMTPYAMTSHFAFDMIWLLFVLRGGWIGHGLAGLVALLAAGLHQWHFPLLFIAPFILWLLARRQWRAALFHGLICIAMMVVWARLWPLLLIDQVGLPPPADLGRTNGIVDKLQSLFGRLDGWQPLLNGARLFAWNNLLLLPLALTALFGVRWRALLRQPPIVAPLLLVVLLGMGLSLYQGYGWGSRYMHGGIGALCLLAGLGWAALRRGGGREANRFIAVSAVVSLLAGLWLLVDTERYVRGYARTMAVIRAADADVVLVDMRGGYYLTDLVRFEDGRLGAPVVMALQRLSFGQLDSLCATHKVAIADQTLFRPLGVQPVPPVFQGSEFIQMRRDRLEAMGCGTVLRPR